VGVGGGKRQKWPECRKIIKKAQIGDKLAPPGNGEDKLKCEGSKKTNVHFWFSSGPDRSFPVHHSSLGWKLGHGKGGANSWGGQPGTQRQNQSGSVRENEGISLGGRGTFTCQNVHTGCKNSPERGKNRCVGREAGYNNGCGSYSFHLKGSKRQSTAQKDLGGGTH